MNIKNQFVCFFYMKMTAYIHTNVPNTSFSPYLINRFVSFKSLQKPNGIALHISLDVWSFVQICEILTAVVRHYYQVIGDGGFGW